MITAAAVIMICVFMAFVFGGQRTIAEFGVGLASAVAIDAFVLRTVLVPALMHLFGRANWWLPRWLDRLLPQVSIEGAPIPAAPVRPVTNTFIAPAPKDAQPKPKPKPKSLVVAYLWWTVLGVFGAHQFYLGRKRRGYLYLFTAGLCGLAWLIDLFTLPGQLGQTNVRLRTEPREVRLPEMSTLI
jgi:RND superfamily putative drug exporter